MNQMHGIAVQCRPHGLFSIAILLLTVAACSPPLATATKTASPTALEPAAPSLSSVNANAEIDELDVVSAVVQLRCSELKESSGLAFSIRDETCVWTHNDSGGLAKLYCFDHRSGVLTGTCLLEGVAAIDWEDISIAKGNQNQPPQIIIADIGDNLAQRPAVKILLVAEPDPHAVTTVSAEHITVATFRYPSGPQDAEAIWFDPTVQELFVVAKSRFPLVGVFSIPHSSLLSCEVGAVDAMPIVAKRVATLPLPMATGADRDAQTGDVWITSYWQAWKFSAVTLDNLMGRIHQAIISSSDTPSSTMPIAYDLPKWRQIEAVAVDSHSGVWIDTEGESPQLGRLQMNAAPPTETKTLPRVQSTFNHKQP